MGKLFNPKQVFKSKYILKLFIQDSTHGNKLECSLTALKANKILLLCFFNRKQVHHTQFSFVLLVRHQNNLEETAQKTQNRGKKFVSQQYIGLQGLVNLLKVLFFHSYEALYVILIRLSQLLKCQQGYTLAFYTCSDHFLWIQLPYQISGFI